jgi:hypothetical protein
MAHVDDLLGYESNFGGRRRGLTRWFRTCGAIVYPSIREAAHHVGHNLGHSVTAACIDALRDRLSRFE